MVFYFLFLTISFKLFSSWKTSCSLYLNTHTNYILTNLSKILYMVFLKIFVQELKYLHFSACNHLTIQI